MKKMLTGIILLVTLFVFTACGGVASPGSEADGSGTNSMAAGGAQEYSVKGGTIPFDTDEEIGHLDYKGSSAMELSYGSYSNPTCLSWNYYNSELHSDGYAIRINMEYDPAYTLDEFIEEAENPAIKDHPVEINGLTWYYVNTSFEDHISATYYYDSPEGMYRFSCLTKTDTGVDIEDFAEMFMSYVTRQND